MSIREIHLVLPGHDSVWTVWSDALADPISGGGEEHAKSCVLERRVVIRGDPEQYVRSPDGFWYRWDGAQWVTRPEGGGAVWCDADDCPACACPFIPGSCSAAA